VTSLFCFQEALNNERSFLLGRTGEPRSASTILLRDVLQLRFASTVEKARFKYTQKKIRDHPLIQRHPRSIS
jgi:hypothetical protein